MSAPGLSRKAKNYNFKYKSQYSNKINSTCSFQFKKMVGVRVLLPVKVNSLEVCWNSLFALEPSRLDFPNKRNWIQHLFIYKQFYLQNCLYDFVNRVHTWKISAEVHLLEWNQLNLVSHLKIDKFKLQQNS